MEFEVLRENLVKSLSVSNKAISAKSSLPVLQNVLIEADEGRLKLVTSDLEKSIVTWVGAKIKGEGSVTIPAKLLYNFVSSLKDERLKGTLKKDKLEISTDSTKAVFNGTEADSYPQFSYSISKNTLEIPSDVLKRAVEETYFSASTDDTRPEWTGILLESTKEGLLFVALDGFRMSKKVVKLSTKELPSFEKALIPAKNLLEVIRLAPSNFSIHLDLQPEKGNAVFALDDVFFVSKLLEGDFPDYNAVIPSDFSCTVVVKYDDFFNAIRASSVFSKNTGAVRLKINKQEKTITFISDDLELGSNEQTIKTVSISGEDIDLAFNLKYLLDYLNNVNSEEVELKISGVSSPSLITPKGRTDYTHIVVPVQPYWEE
ncbi:MAG TPA: DNA polymerase III subunit beta [candidate division WWE3 bacterium]|uniref:Beta sliding clamp n=1 Tax=candidate division WWE3 bacterium TaxID=2053526 RepID=A0A7V5MHY6_UNCKA|nr:DNA polymerase III subunit beta [candidate division WWE3 bacterium]